jgi:hypothetical protein
MRRALAEAVGPRSVTDRRARSLDAGHRHDDGSQQRQAKADRKDSTEPHCKFGWCRIVASLMAVAGEHQAANI